MIAVIPVPWKTELKTPPYNAALLVELALEFGEAAAFARVGFAGNHLLDGGEFVSGEAGAVDHLAFEGGVGEGEVDAFAAHFQCLEFQIIGRA